MVKDWQILLIMQVQYKLLSPHRFNLENSPSKLSFFQPFPKFQKASSSFHHRSFILIFLPSAQRSRHRCSLFLNGMSEMMISMSKESVLKIKLERMIVLALSRELEHWLTYSEKCLRLRMRNSIHGPLGSYRLKASLGPVIRVLVFGC